MASRKTDLLAVMALVFIGLLPFINLLGLPPFVDEGCHIWWVERVVEEGDWVRPFDAGKPFEAWLPVPFVWLGAEPLTVMRILHVTAGLVCVLLVYVLAARIATRTTAFVSVVLTAVCPFIVFYQRLALTEIYLCAAGLLTLLFVIWFWQEQTWKSAILLGVSLVLAAFAKFPIGFVFMASVPLALIVMPESDRAKLLAPEGQLKLLVAYAPVGLLLCGVIVVVVLRLQLGLRPGFGLINIGYQTESVNRVATILANLHQLLDVLVVQVTWPVVILASVGVIFTFLKGNAYQRWLVIMGIVPIVGMMLVSSVWFARYLVFVVPPLIVGAVCGWGILLEPLGKAKNVVAAVLLVICGVLMGYQSVLIVLDPPSARGMGGYVSGWTSGYGYPELAHYLQDAPDTPPVVYTLDIVTAMQLRAQLPGEWAERVQQLHIVDGKYLNMEEKQSYLLTKAPTWLVAPQALDNQDSFVANHLRRLIGFTRPYSQTQVTLYEVTN